MFYKGNLFTKIWFKVDISFSYECFYPTNASEDEMFL